MQAAEQRNWAVSNAMTTVIKENFRKCSVEGCNKLGKQMSNYRYPLDTDQIQSPLMYNQVAYHGYGVHKTTGEMYSCRVSGEWRRRKWSIGGNMKYPFCMIIGDDGHKKSASWHKACCETLKPQPAPPSVSDAEWTATPNSVKQLLHKIWQVNHIDHNHLNFNPDNLEWVTGEENVAKYQQHRLQLAA